MKTILKDKWTKYQSRNNKKKILSNKRYLDMNNSMKMYLIDLKLNNNE